MAIDLYKGWAWYGKFNCTGQDEVCNRWNNEARARRRYRKILEELRKKKREELKVGRVKSMAA